MASPGNRHCASCIGALLFPITDEQRRRSEGEPKEPHIGAIWKIRLNDTCDAAFCAITVIACYCCM